MLVLFSGVSAFRHPLATARLFMNICRSTLYFSCSHLFYRHGAFAIHRMLVSEWAVCIHSVQRLPGGFLHPTWLLDIITLENELA